MNSGERVGPFELIERLHVPEAGSWYRAERIGVSSRRPAFALVKRLEGDVGPSEREALQREHATLVALQDDPRIPTPVGHYDGAGAIAFEPVSGHSLAAWAEVRGEDGLGMSRATLLDIAIELAEAIKSSHHRGRHHGHIAPELVWLDETGKLTLWGFGPGPDTAPPDAWLAPERARGEPTRGATDLWSLGALLAFLITGKAAWEGADLASAARRGDTGALIAPVAATWPAMARLLRQLLDNRPQNRPASIHPVQKELLALSRKEGVASDRHDLGARLAERFAPPEPEPEPEPESVPTAIDEPEEPELSHDDPTDEPLPSFAVVRPAAAVAAQRPQRTPLPNEVLPVVRMQPLVSVDLPKPTGAKEEDEEETEQFTGDLAGALSLGSISLSDGDPVVEDEPDDALAEASEDEDDEASEDLITDDSPVPLTIAGPGATMVPRSADLVDEPEPSPLPIDGPALGTAEELPDLLPPRASTTIERVAPALVVLMIIAMLLTVILSLTS